MANLTHPKRSLPVFDRFMGRSMVVSSGEPSAPRPCHLQGWSHPCALCYSGHVAVASLCTEPTPVEGADDHG